jgi:hypothetical protein
MRTCIHGRTEKQKCKKCNEHESFFVPELEDSMKETYLEENIRLHKEANLNMQEICRLRGQVARVRSNIVKIVAGIKRSK